MSPLTIQDLRSRLALDYRAMRSLRGHTIGRIEAFASPLDVAARREVTEAQGLAGLATVYRVEFRFPMLRSAREGLPRAFAIFQATSRDYPYAEPSVGFERGSIPFAPHIAPGSGHVCLGEAWRVANGQWLLVNLVLHVMRLANFHEPATLDSFSQEAFDYANHVLQGTPLNPDLDYPVIDEEVTHASEEPTRISPVNAGSLFRRSSGFAPRMQPAASAPPAFRRRAL
ncbi:MAG: hypothetical protein JWM10_755 [Myxococcaceae bacterium]|nr:hypothetical protein [Myxococcaceae bacterium]